MCLTLLISTYVFFVTAVNTTRLKQGPLDIVSETNTVRAATLTVFNKSVDIGKIDKQ